MDAYLQWLLAASGVILLAGWLGYRALQRAAGRRKTARKEAEAAARVEVLRRAGEEAARRRVAQEAAARAAAAAARGVAEHAAQRAERATRAEAARQAAAAAAAAREAAAAAARAQAAAKAHAQAAARAAEQALALAQAHAQALAQADRLAAQAALQREAQRQVAALAAAESVRPAPPAAGAPVKAPDQTLVMVADDSKVVRVKTGRLLAQHQYRVSYAVDGLDAVRQMQTCIPDVVVTDIEMPGMDGFELTRHVRQNPLTAHIPIIMITAADDKHRDHAQRAGVTVLLGKPYPEDALIAHIRRAMGVGLVPAA